MPSLSIAAYRRIVVLTGPGINAPDSGVSISGPAADETVSGVDQLQAVWAEFSRRRMQALAMDPNPAHRALVSLQTNLDDDQSLSLLTFCQDGLHTRAGSPEVLELFGSLLHSRCRTAGCSLPHFYDPHDHSERLPFCPFCGQPLYPGIRNPDEPIPFDLQLQAHRALRRSDLFLMVGLRHWRAPAEAFLRLAQQAGAETVYLGRQPLSSDEAQFDYYLSGAPADLLPALLEQQAPD